jgi:hypothetical protein
MRRGLIAFAFMLGGFLPAIAQQSSGGTAARAPSSTFLPLIGQSAQYQYSDTVTTQKGSRRLTAVITLTSVTAKEIRASIEINGKESRNVEFYLDDTGTLQPTSMPEPEANSTRKRSNHYNEQADAVHAFVSRISLASRIAAHPAEEESFPVKISLPGASCPLQPTLVLKPTQTETLVANASDTTSVSSPQARHGLFMPLGLGIGAGFIGGAIGGTPGRIVGLSISATSLVITLLRSHHSGPLPADVGLHIEGKLADNRLQTLSGDQEVVIHGKRTRTISDRWSLVARSATTAAL